MPPPGPIRIAAIPSRAEIEQLVEAASRSNGARSAVACTSTSRSAPVADDVHVDLGARVLRSSRGRAASSPPTIPTETAATELGERAREAEPCRARAPAATYAPEIAAQRVPPSAWSTSQSSQSVRSPSASKSVTARSARPISRWISTVRPFCLPALASRCGPLAGRGRQQRVLGRQPAAAPSRAASAERPRPATRVQSTRVFPASRAPTPQRLLEVVERRSRAGRS